MKKILALFMLCSFAILSGCQAAQNEGGPTNEPRETIIKEAPFHQGESDYEPQPETKKCFVSGCNNSTCYHEIIERVGCSFHPENDCYKKTICKYNPYYKRCSWEETDEFNECRKLAEEEIKLISKQFMETRDNCDPNKPCTFEYSYRDDRFEFTLPYGEWPSFKGGSIMIIDTVDYDDMAGTSFPVFRIAIDTDEHFVDPSEIWDVEDIEVNGASGIKYKYDSYWSEDGCDAYRLEYKDKFYYFEGYEGCISFGNEFSDSLRFY